MKSVVICGSKRFTLEIREFANDLKKLGVTVFEPHLHSSKEEWEKLSDTYKKLVALGLTHDHMYKIKMADVIYVYNKNGYAGVSLTLEIGAALILNKPIYAYSDKDSELVRLVLFREIIKSPKELYNKLK